MQPITGMYIAFKGIRNDAVGAALVDMPVTTLPSPKGERVDIPGRDGSLWLPDGGFGDATIRVNFAILDSANRQAVLDWLSGGGSLILGDDPNYYYKNARVLSAMTLNSITPRLAGRLVSATFTCFPFRFRVNEPEMEFTEEAVFIGQGSDRARPIITVYGNGDINLMVNDCTVLLEDVDDHITLDCEAMMAFKDGVNVSPQVTLLSDTSDDEWPYLNPAGQENAINWSDDDGDASTALNVTRVVVQPNWRFR